MNGSTAQPNKDQDSVKAGSANPASWQNLPSINKVFEAGGAMLTPSMRVAAKSVAKAETKKTEVTAQKPGESASPQRSFSAVGAAVNVKNTLPLQATSQTVVGAEKGTVGILHKQGPVERVKPGEKKKHKRMPVDVSDVIGCGVLVVLLLIVLGAAMLYGVAKAGLVHVPLLSNFYEEPAVARKVESQPVSWDEFRANITTKVLARGINNGPPYTLLINETELTGLLLGVIENGLRSPSYDVRDAQVAIRSEDLELFFYITWRDFLNFKLIAHLYPELETDGTLTFKVKDADLGDMPLPMNTVMHMMGYFFARDVGSWKIITSDGSGIQSVLFSDGAMQLMVGPLSNIQQ